MLWPKLPNKSGLGIKDLKDLGICESKETI